MRNSRRLLQGGPLTNDKLHAMADAGVKSQSAPAPVAADLDLDLRGLKCPLPALKLQAALDRLREGAIVRVTTTDPMAVIDVPHLVGQRGDELIDAIRREDAAVFVIRKRRSAEQT
jgi:tRNA 2-thiouridine synthesizing protein A